VGLTISTTSGGAQGCGGVVGRILSTLFLSVFVGMGLVFCFFVGREVVREQSWWQALMLLIPLVFIVFGVGGIVMVWRKKRPEAEEPAGPISARAPGGRGCLHIGGGLVFLAVGLGAFFFMFVRPALSVYEARGWPETKCRVISSAVGSHDSDDGTTYSVDIVFEYQRHGVTLRSDSYDFSNWSSSGYRGKKEIVDRYPAGSTTWCYVNPADPSRAVLDRSFRPVYLVGLFPLLFVGAGVLILALYPGRRKKAQRSDLQEEVEDLGGPVTLSPRFGPVAKLLGVILMAAFWNGLVSVFVIEMVKGWRAGSPDWFLTFFLVPFVLVGLGLIAGIGYTGLALLNPRPRLTLSRRVYRLGEVVDVSWAFSGSTSRISRLRVVLEGREEATYTRGTDTQTDTEVFVELVLVDTENSFEIGQGRSEVRLPEDTMHSFEAAHNKVVLALKVNGDILKWPDVNEEFALKIDPPRAKETRW